MEEAYVALSHFSIAALVLDLTWQKLNSRRALLTFCSLQQLSKLPKVLSLSRYRVCALVLPLPYSFSEIGKAENYVFLCQETPAAALEQLSCCS